MRLPLKPWQTFLRERSAALGIELGDAQLDAFDTYLRELLDWNRRVNLTSITEPDEVAALHFFDSLTCLAALPFPLAARVADVGSGCGLPGIALGIARPDLSITLVESVAKKCRFLEHMACSLAAARASVYCGRAELAGRDPGLREAFDIVVTRAVAELAVAAELCLPLVKLGGAALVMKGPKAQEEIERAGGAIHLLGGQLEFTRDFVIPAPGGPVSRTIIILRKRSPTGDQYPRRPGLPSKRPLV